ncbi:UTP--glucose-1-phosphate uridylyltransferase GalU [Fundicoccus sp. Sow4_F4]|uniref:UTP--glucose-1-phosphate uridylyltransferase GalU n=1 Tax=Fundicoccus sp. Sow4_F4 TaxID=3438783 RepID=UPI003F92D8E6
MRKIKKAVIPAAGYGTGFLPATKATAKEMLPIVDKPIIQFIVEEALASGIEEILIITGRHKRPIEDHFDSNVELEQNLAEKGKWELLELVKSTTKADLFFVRQAYPKGLGDAISQAKSFIGDEAFVVMLGDNILESDVPVTKQLLDLYEVNGAANIAVIDMLQAETDQYGIIEIDQAVDGFDGDVFSLLGLVEKPSPAEAPSQLGIAGRYVLTPQIFDILENLAPGKDGEVQLTDAIATLNQTQRVFAKRIEGKLYDVGNRMGYVDLSLQYGLKHPEIGAGLREYLIQMSQALRAQDN